MPMPEDAPVTMQVRSGPGRGMAIPGGYEDVAGIGSSPRMVMRHISRRCPA